MHLNTNAILLNPGRLAQILSAGVRSFNISVDGPRAVHNKIRGRDWAYDRTIQHLVHLIGLRDQFGLKIRMNFTVMRDNIAVLPEVARLAQKLRVKLYLNLATDRTFLFRDGAVTDQAMVPEPVLIETLARLEEIARRDARWLPRFSDLAYIPKHFSDVVQRHLPCAESQLKLMIHSRGEIGGCWGHDARFNVRETPIAAVIDGLHYREEHARLFRKECVGCGSNYSLNLRWRLPTYVRDLMWRFGWQRL